jgi:hypothetical protein
MTSTSSLPFPHPTLTPIIGKLDAATLKLLRKEVYANTKSVPSTAGGGLNGHLGIAMPAGAYTISAGQAFDDPAHPGPLPVHAVGIAPASHERWERKKRRKKEDSVVREVRNR